MLRTGGGHFVQCAFTWPLYPRGGGPLFHMVHDYPVELIAARYHGKQLSQWLQQGPRQ